jgi:hypothetical protein
MTQQIVVWDPAGMYPEGAIVTDLQSLALLARGIVLLPVVPRLFQSSGVGGYARRAWGDGVDLDTQMPRLTCPLTIYMAKELRTLHWRARLVPKTTGAALFGQVRLAADGNQPGAQNVSFQPEESVVDLRALGAPDANDGWTIGGKGIVSPSTDCYAGFALYGTGAGLRVVWAAISQAEV